MQTYARVVDGFAVEIITLPDGMAPSDAYHPDVATTIVPCPATVEQGWTVSGGQWSPPVTPAPTQEDLIAHAAAARFAKETGGIEVAGSPIATDRESQAMISGAFALVQAQPDTTIRFKTPAGFVTLSAAQMSGIAVAVAQHVQACFGLEADVAADIEAGEITTIAEIDAAFAG